MAEPSIFTPGAVGVLLPGLKPPRAAGLSSVCCHFPRAQPNLAFPVLVCVAQNEAAFPSWLLTLSRREVLVMLLIGMGNILWTWQCIPAELCCSWQGSQGSNSSRAGNACGCQPSCCC